MKKELEVAHVMSQGYYIKKKTNGVFKLLTTTNSKRNKLEMVASQVNLWVLNEPFKLELCRSFPPFWDPLDGIHIDE
jgi:hypothetical protein